VDIAFDAKMPGEIKGSIDAKTSDFMRAVVWACDGSAATDLRAV
jgi:hypothetical protein